MNQPKPKTEKKTCESCGENFDCGANAEKCWCFEIDLSAEVLQDLRENFNSCLCPNCVQSYGFSRENVGDSST